MAWGSNLDWGFEKHPPLSAFAVEMFFIKYLVSQDWAYYFLSQIFVISAFLLFGNFQRNFLKKIIAFYQYFYLEGIYFYNFTTPEFNVNVAQLPFWALTVYYTWRRV